MRLGKKNPTIKKLVLKYLHLKLVQPKLSLFLHQCTMSYTERQPYMVYGNQWACLRWLGNLKFLYRETLIFLSMRTRSIRHDAHKSIRPPAGGRYTHVLKTTNREWSESVMAGNAKSARKRQKRRKRDKNKTSQEHSANHNYIILARIPWHDLSTTTKSWTIC